MMSLPRVLKLDKDGTLRITTLPQLDELRDGSLAAKETGDGLRLVLPHASGEVLCTGAQGSAMELTMSDGAKELLRVSYSPEKHSMIADGKEIVLETGDVPKLHAFVDASVIELVLGERIGYTKRFYVEGPVASDIQLHATGNGISLSAWKVSPISNNRLTTPASGGLA
jgi:beta-fructofuranosidase